LGAECRDDRSRNVERRDDQSRPAVAARCEKPSARAAAAPVDATVYAPVRLPATTVELTVGNIAAPVEAIRKPVVICHFRPVGRAVEAAVDGVALSVEAPFDAIAAVGGSSRRPVTGCILRQDWPAEQAQSQSRGRNETSLSHIRSPRKP
jgi:hypothetical protein